MKKIDEKIDDHENPEGTNLDNKPMSIWRSLLFNI